MGIQSKVERMKLGIYGFILYSPLAGYGKLMGYLDAGIFEEALQSLVLEVR